MLSWILLFSQSFCKPLIELILHDVLHPIISCKSRTWKSADISFGTYLETILFSLNNNVTSSVFDLEKRPILKVQIEQVFLFFSVTTYDMTVSSRCFNTFWVLLCCLMFVIKLKSAGILALGFSFICCLKW